MAMSVLVPASGLGGHVLATAKGPKSPPLFLLPNFTFVIELVVFLLVLGFMAKFVLPPLRTARSEREAGIRHAVESAERARVEAEQLSAERRGVLEQARQEARSTVDQANETAEQLREQGRSRGQEEFDRLVAAAQANIGAQRQRAHDEVMEGVGTLVLHAAERVIGADLDTEQYRPLVDEAITAVEASNAGG